MLNSYFATILLTKEATNDWYRLLAQGVTSNVVGDCEKDKRVQHSVELGAPLARHERVGAARLHCHCGAK